MTGWEYKVLNLAVTQLAVGSEYASVLEKILNLHGKAGWELGMLAGPRNDLDSVAVLKRPLATPEQS